MFLNPALQVIPSGKRLGVGAEYLHVDERVLYPLGLEVKGEFGYRASDLPCVLYLPAQVKDINFYLLRAVPCSLSEIMGIVNPHVLLVKPGSHDSPCLVYRSIEIIKSVGVNHKRCAELIPVHVILILFSSHIGLL